MDPTDVRRDDAPAVDPAGPGQHARHRDDRWAWRRAIRADPHRYRIYKIVVGAVGVLLILLGAATGWLPGPGGIPLALLGLAVLASEFEWAHRLLVRARARARLLADRARQRPAWERWLMGTLAVIGVLAAVTVLAALLLGVPDWVPDPVAALLAALPGVG